MEMNIEIVANLDLGQSIWARLPYFLYACSAVKKFSSVWNENIIYCFQWPQVSETLPFYFQKSKTYLQAPRSSSIRSCWIGTLSESSRKNLPSSTGARRSGSGSGLDSTPSGTGQPAIASWTRSSRRPGACSTATTPWGGRCQTASMRLDTCKCFQSSVTIV